MRPLIPALVLCLSSVVWAQAPTGQITGTVSDPSGAVVSGAAVTAINAATNVRRETSTNESGIFNLPALPPGLYNLHVESAGFPRQVREGLELQVGQVARVDFSLQMGNVAETIQVSGAAPILQSETAELGTVIENRRIVDLPLNGRNYLQLASLAPGVTTNGPASSQGQQRMGGARNQFSMNVAGQRVHYNHFTLDGVENTDPNFNTYLMLPSIDALQEFKIESGIFQAEYGRAIAQVNVSTKSGTNDIHGAAFEFLRNSAMDAKNYFDRGDQPIPPFKRNQFGATVGGPIKKDRIFWLFSYEGLRERKALTSVGLVPTPAFRAGDFSGIATTIVDPLTKVVQGGQVVSSTPFPGNRIPENRISPTSRRVLNDFYPLPNLVGPNNFINNEGRSSNSDQYHGRIDFAESSNSNWFFRYSDATDTQYLPSFAPVTGNNVDVEAKQVVLANTRLFGANKVNEFRFAVNRFVSQNIQTRANKLDVVSALGIPGLDPSISLFWGIPVFQISGFNTIGECNDCPFVNWNTTFQLKDDFSWTKGRHQVKFGGELRRLRYNQIGAVVPRGRFTFNGQYSNQPMGDFLLGYMNNSEGQVGAPIANFRNNYVALYLQDSWKVTNKLTVNLGLRWEVETPFIDKHDAIVNIDFRWDNTREPVFVRAGTGDIMQGNPKFPVGAPYTLVRDGRFGRRAHMADWNDIAPRLGIAYALDDKTVIRTGAGIYYVRDIGNAVFDIVRNIPFTIRQNEPATPLVPNLSWDRPFSRPGAPTFILANQFDEPTSYVAQWSFGIQRALTRETSFEASYIGSSGVKLRRLQSYNTAVPGPGANNPRRPFPFLGGNIQVMNAAANSNYHALHLRLQHRLTYGFTLLSSYAYGKSIDQGSGIRTTDGDPLTPSDNYNLRGERGRSAFDFRQRWTNSFVYELPFGRGKRWLGQGGVSNVLLGGWQLGGIITLQSGFPITPGCGPGNWQNADTNCRPDPTGIKPELPRGQQDPNRWFNLDAFVNRIGIANNRPQDVAEYRFGFAGRSLFDGPGIIGVDASVMKNFYIKEGYRLEFRGEFFNLPNHPLFGHPVAAPGNPRYGVISSTRIDPRDIQLALKFVF
ncbi:MAG: carboxypeptidase regulatory-like domain-containing protein [Bryobacteraceae bacterium]